MTAPQPPYGADDPYQQQPPPYPPQPGSPYPGQPMPYPSPQGAHGGVNQYGRPLSDKSKLAAGLLGALISATARSARATLVESEQILGDVVPEYRPMFRCLIGVYHKRLDGVGMRGPAIIRPLSRQAIDVPARTGPLPSFGCIDESPPPLRETAEAAEAVLSCR